MKKTQLIALMLLGCALGWSADWLTDGADIERTHWQKDEKTISTANAGKIKLLWKVKIDATPRVMSNLHTPVIAGRVSVKGVMKEVALMTTFDNQILAIDAKDGSTIWKKKFDSSYQDPPPTPGGRGGSILCPGGLSATPVLQQVAPGKYTIYVDTWDGTLHQMNLADGEDIAPPSKFTPPNAKPWALNMYKGVLYTHTSQGCGGNPNVAYAYDIASHKVGSWGPAGGGMWGRTGPAISPTTGAMYTGTGDGQWNPDAGVYGNGMIGLKQDPTTKELKLVDAFGPPNAAWLVKRDLDAQVTPVIFNYKGKEIMISGSKECRLWVMDTKSIGGADGRTDLFTTPLFCNEDVNFASAGIWGSLATWLDAKGTRWVLSPFWGPKHSKYDFPINNGTVKRGAIAAFKVEDPGGKIQLTPAWVSRDMDQAEPPVIANGVIYAYGSGENTDQAYYDVGLEDTAARRIPASTKAVLYALDAQTGKELWNSGDDIKSWLHAGELAIANGKVYIGTWDGMLYCYGIASK